MADTATIQSARRADEPSGSSRRTAARLVTPTSVHYCVLGFGFVAIMLAARNHWFHSDEWDFIAQRGLSGADFSIWWPHMEHWSTLPILVWRALQAVFGLDTYMPYMAVSVAIHCGVAHVLWRIMRRCEVAPWLATAFAALFLFYGTGYENIAWAFQMTFNGGLLLGLGAMLALDRVTPRDLTWTAVGTACLVAGLPVAGVILPFVPVAAALAVIRGGWRRGLVVAGFPAAVYLLWLVLIGHNGLGVSSELAGKDTLTVLTEGLVGAPQFIWTAFTHTLDGLWGVTGVGAVLVFVIAGFACVRMGSDRWRTTGLLALAAAVVAGTQMAFAGLSRIAAFGVGAAATSRYAYIVIALILPIMAVAATNAREFEPAGPVIVWVLVVSATLWGGFALVDLLREQSRDQQGARVALLAAARVLADGTVPAEGARATDGPSSVTVDQLERLVAAGEIVVPSSVDPSEYAMARARVQVALVRNPAGPSPGVGGETVCRDAVAGGDAVAFPVTQPGAVSVKAKDPTEIDVALIEGTPDIDPDSVSGWRTFKVSEDDAHVATTANEGTLMIRVPESEASPISVCNP